MLCTSFEFRWWSNCVLSGSTCRNF